MQVSSPPDISSYSGEPPENCRERLWANFWLDQGIVFHNSADFSSVTMSWSLRRSSRDNAAPLEKKLYDNFLTLHDAFMRPSWRSEDRPEGAVKCRKCCEASQKLMTLSGLAFEQRDIRHEYGINSHWIKNLYLYLYLGYRLNYFTIEFHICIVGCVIAQAFFSHGASDISLKFRGFWANLAWFNVI